MSTLKVNNLQVGQDATATNNFTLYQPASPDGTVRLGVGNSGSVTDILTLNSSSYIGIGTDNPSAKLDLRGTLSVSTSIVNVLRGDTTYPTISIRDNATASDAAGDVLISGYYPIVFNTDIGFERMRIARDGNVGIGTTDPQNKLHLYTTSGNDGLVVENTSTANIAVTAAKNGEATVQMGQFGSTASGTTFGLTNSNLSFIYTTSYGTTHPSALAIGTVSNIPVVIATNNTERFRIEGGGTIGIGGNGTGSGLGVYLQRSSPATTQFYEASDGTKTMITGVDSTNDFVKIGSLSNHRVGLVAQNGEKISILPGGNIGIGTTNPQTKLHVYGDFYAQTGYVSANYKITKGNGNYLSRAFTYHNYKTGWSNGAWVGHYRFTRTSSQANNGLIGVIGGMLHIVYVNERTNTVQTSGYDSFPIIVRMRSNDTAQVGIGAAMANVETVIGSSVEVRSANASATSIDIEIRIYNSDGANGENFCHSWIDFGAAASHSNQFPEITLL